ncbi:MAG TPA: penicillin-binding protein activator [Steroidobacteraceae bacterium]|nr:penicillin-binding protein activator [Steroidobacteraceae bacterium]
MAAISRRPRLPLCAALTVTAILAACSLVKPEQAPEERQERAVRLSQEGKHADAAQAYAELADLQPAEHDNYELLSAEQWLAAGNIEAAKRAFAAAPEARTRLPAARALVAAEIAFAENDGARAIRELDQIPVPTSADQAQNYWWIRGRSAFLTGHPLEGTRALVERERWLSDPVSLGANRAELYSRIRSAAERGQPLSPPPNTDPVIVGWLQLGPVAVGLARDPMRAAAALANWRRLFPQHPANQSVLAMASTEIAAATEFPDQIALLLPLSGRAEAVGVAVRDGFVAAYLEQEPASRPRLRIYDVATESAGSAYSRALSEGAGFVVGPLTKEDVAAVAPLSGNTPVLALNFLGDAISAPRNFYQFALSPEDEARIVARRVAADGRLNGVAIVPSSEWGKRVAAAFVDELSHLGGTLLDSQQFETSQVDFSDIIKQVLQVHVVKGEPSTHRTDAAFVFVAAGSAGIARQILPQLKFHYAGDVPVYSTSDSFEPDPTANSDLDGMLFPDMPWMVANDPVTVQIRDGVRAAWPARTQRRDRLYAFGFDAYRLLPALRTKTPVEGGEISGVTGKLHLDDHNRVRRDLEWAQIRNGEPSGL